MPTCFVDDLSLAFNPYSRRDDVESIGSVHRERDAVRRFRVDERSHVLATASDSREIIGIGVDGTFGTLAEVPDGRFDHP